MKFYCSERSPESSRSNPARAALCLPWQSHLLPALERWMIGQPTAAPCSAQGSPSTAQVLPAPSAPVLLGAR